MKKIIGLLLGLLLVASIGLAEAPQERELPGEADGAAEKAAVMDTPEGAEMRLMQLENAMSNNVIMGQKALEVALEKNPEADTAELERVVAELETIKEEIEEKIQQGEAQNKEPAEIVQDFLTIKEEGRNLTNEFRENVQGLLDEEERQQVREEARQRANEELEEKRENIQERIREHNAEQVKRVLERMGVEDPELVEQVRNGEINTGEAISQVAQEFRGLGQERRQEVRVEMDVERRDRAENAQQAVNNARENLEERMNERASERMGKVEEKLSQVRERIKENLPEQARGKIGERIGPPADPTGEENDEEIPPNGEDLNGTDRGVSV